MILLLSNLSFAEGLKGTVGVKGKIKNKVIHDVAVTWNASTTSPVSYNVKRGNATGGPYSNIHTGLSVLVYVDYNVQSGQTYYYVITAVCTDSTNVNCTNGSESSYSNETFKTVP